MDTSRRRDASSLLLANSAIFVSLALFAVGCAPPYPYEVFPPRAYPALGTLAEKHASINVLYATDRNRTPFANPADYYGNDRARNVQYGNCVVSIPAAHGRGRLEAPALAIAGNPDRHVILASVEPINGAPSFIAELRRRVALSPQKQILVFVHGYCATFEDVTRRTAQIAHDTDFDGVPIAYCWPAQGFLLSYLVDANNIEWTEPHLVEFLLMLARESGAERIHIMAHSMGNRVLARAVRETVRQRDVEAAIGAGRPESRVDEHSSPNLARADNHIAAAGPMFDQIVLAAADIDAEIFERDYAPPMVRAARRVTIYVSARDSVMAGSHRVHKYARLGEPGPTSRPAPATTPASASPLDSGSAATNGSETLAGLPRLGNIDVIDATNVDRGLLGHYYYGECPAILNDLQNVWLGASAASRGLEKPDAYYAFPRHPAR